jgi:hypothetical protein
LQSVGEALHKSDDRLPNGISKFVVFLEAINPTQLGIEAHRREFEKTLEAWKANFPKSDLPLVANGYARINEGNPAGLFAVTEPNPALDQQRKTGANEAESLVKGVAEESEYFDDAQLLRLLTHRDLALPIDPLIEVLLKANPTRLEIYERVASYAFVHDPNLLSGWMDQCVDGSKKELGEGAYALMADLALPYQAVDTVPLEWTRIDRGYADLCAKYPSWTLPQRRLFWAVIFKKRTRAKELADEIGVAKLDFRVFSGWENLDHAKEWLAQ